MREAVINKEIRNLRLHWEVLHPKVKKKITSNWIEWVNQTPQLAIQQDRQHVNKILRTPWFSKIKSNRKATIIITRIRSQHTTTNAHLHKIQLSNSPYCDCADGQFIEDLNHIYFFSMYKI